MIDRVDIWDMTKVDKKQYMAMLSQLKKNEENVPKELLRTKYRSGYERLRNELKEATCQLMQEAVFYGLLIRKEDASAVCAEINQMIENYGFMAEIKQAVYQSYDIDQLTGLVIFLRMRIHDVAERWLDNGK
ncbi:MAG: hypothetical protein KH366_10650 [Clostridiaceae bacterium]|nr:hypothetical protein [Clostridiaceae bacterium]